MPIRVCATPDKKDQLGFALQSAEFALRYYNRFFTMKYPFDKLDLLAVPDFEASASREAIQAAALGYARELRALIDELRERRVSGARLRRAAAKAGLARHALRASQEVEEYEALLSRIRRADAGARAAAALDALRRSPWLWGTTPVHLYGFDDLTRLQLDESGNFGFLTRHESWSGPVLLFDMQGQEIWSYGSRSFSGADDSVAGDIDGDGRPEFAGGAQGTQPRRA